jgi:hypothetical protein
MDWIAVTGQRADDQPVIPDLAEILFPARRRRQQIVDVDVIGAWKRTGADLDGFETGRLYALQHLLK